MTDSIDLAELLQQIIPEWVDDAACGQIDGDLWFPEGSGTSIKAVKEICESCPVKKMCLEYAVNGHINHGIWGGASPRTRVLIRKARGIAELPEEDFDD